MSFEDFNNEANSSGTADRAFIATIDRNCGQTPSNWRFLRKAKHDGILDSVGE
jgi:hypothetical protein